MRHGKKFNHLGRTKPHRRAMLSNMACSLIQHKRINTTLAKAKALRGFVEPLITKSKDDSTHSRRVVFKYLNDKLAVSELFRDVAPKIGQRPGGYTRIIKTGNRLGDNAEMCMMELVDFNEIYTSDKKETAGKKKRTRRRGSGGGAKASQNEESNDSTATAKPKDEATTAKNTKAATAEKPVAEKSKSAESTSEKKEVKEAKAEAPEEKKESPKNEDDKSKEEK